MAQRRNSQEIRQLILHAALEVFAERSFAATTVGAIAERAGVTRAVLYRHFSGKAQLFEVALAQPFVEFLEEFRPYWEGRMQSSASDVLVVHDLMSFLISKFARHRTALRILLFDAQDIDGDAAANALIAIRETLADFTELAAKGLQMRGYPLDHVDLSVRATIYTAIGFALFDERLAPDDVSGSRTDVLNHITEFIHSGYTLNSRHRPMPEAS